MAGGRLRPDAVVDIVPAASARTLYGSCRGLVRLGLAGLVIGAGVILGGTRSGTARA